MNLTANQEKIIEENNVVVLCTANIIGKPRGIFVGFPKCMGSKIIMVDNYMQITKLNILENPQVFILAYSKDYGQCLKISGTASYRTDTTSLEWAKSLEENKELKPKGIIEIIIKDVAESN
jgi:uncharacterized pyridoxamine 5'-phosphate oxidase family protein